MTKSHPHNLLVVGAGITGAVIARSLAENGIPLLVVDERSHVGGNCHTERDPETGVMLHVYGPHIFHTDNCEVWEYVNRFCEMMPYINRVKAVAAGRVYSLPINLHTINQFFDRVMGPEEARAYLQAVEAQHFDNPANFKEQALSLVGRRIYETFFQGYTTKQWGCDPKELPASILKRLPVRFNYDDNYYAHPWQGIPREGYTAMVSQILDHRNIEVQLNLQYENLRDEFDHVFYSGPIDRFYRFSLGRLPYRTLRFETFRENGDFQGTAVMNYCDESVPYTRITEHKYFSPWELDRHKKTVCYREFSCECGENDLPYYPVRFTNKTKLLSEYVTRAYQEKGVSFVGRLGTYRYLDMDMAVAEALRASKEAVNCLKVGQPLPVFFTDPN